MSVDVRRLRDFYNPPRWHRLTPFGPDGWSTREKHGGMSVIVTTADHRTRAGALSTWVHASVAHATVLPTYDDLVWLKRAVWGEEGEAYQVFAPASRHVSLHDFALHLWGRADGAGVLPVFGAEGSI